MKNLIILNLGNASNLSLEGSLDDARLFYAIYKSGIRLIDNLEL